MLTITANAKKHLKTRCIEKNKKYAYLAMKPSGCAGFEYDWDYADYVDTGNRLVDDILVVEQNAVSYLQDSVVEFNSDLVGSYLTVVNPNILNACGCGMSFTL